MHRCAAILLAVCAILACTAFAGAAEVQTYTATPSADKLQVNGTLVEIQAYRILGSNYVKLRDLAALLGISVGWDSETKTVIINTRSEDAQQETPPAMTAEELLDQAAVAMARSSAPYSRFQVGAALLGKSGKVYLGCNVENAAYGPTNCAERSAVFSAVSQGEREFAAIAIAGGPEGKPEGSCPPCGVCRQVLREFCPDDFPIYLREQSGETTRCTLAELLPRSFGSSNLAQASE